MSKKDDKADAKSFRKPIHDKATRKVSALPRLLKESQRPDGQKASKIEDEEPSSEEQDEDGEHEEQPAEQPSSGRSSADEFNFDPETFDVDDGGLFDDLEDLFDD